MSRSDYDPQKALLVAEPPSGAEWIHELKLDGFRMGVSIAGRGKTRGARIVSRRGTEHTADFPEIVAAGWPTSPSISWRSTVST